MKEKISAMSDEHVNWLGGVDFYKELLGVLRSRLTEIAGKNTNKVAAAEAEHFENQITLYDERLDILAHEIRKNLGRAANQLKTNGAGYVDTVIFVQHDLQREQFVQLEHAIKTLRSELNRFCRTVDVITRHFSK